MSTKVVCHNGKCPYRSKGALRGYRTKSGDKIYTCSKEIIVMSDVYDPDGETVALFGYNPCECVLYAQYRRANITEEVDE